MASTGESPPFQHGVDSTTFCAMDILSILEKRFGHWAIRNLTLYLIAIQLIGVALLMGGYSRYEDLVLVGGLVQVGQWTRLLSFMMIPRTLSPIWLFFSFYVLYMIGSALEKEWGAFRFNLYVLCGYLLTILTAFIAPSAYIFNTYFLGGIFLAFATLFPQVEFRLFFFIPVKVKWLGWLTAGLYILTLLTADTGSRLGVGAALLNYLLFFGRGFVTHLQAGKRRKVYHTNRAVIAAQPLHHCTQCKATDKSHPTLGFRYCSTCGKCYCEEHMSTHSHP